MRLFGGFEVQAGSGRSLAVPTRKAQALLAYLALTPGQAHPRDKLATLLWADASPAAARNALRQTLFVLRKALGSHKGALLIVTGDALTLPPAAVRTDVTAFEQAVATGTTTALESAAALYRGDLLAGLTAEAPGFEDWLMSERERLRELAIESLARLLGQRRAAGATEAAVQLALRLLALDPLQEAVHRTLMRLYAQLGRRDAALRQYQVCVAALQRELAAEPEAETTEVYRDIVRRQTRAAVAPPPPRTTSPASRTPVADLRGKTSQGATAPTAAGVAGAQTVVVAAPEIPVHETPMVGRGIEIARLRELFDHASRGAGSLVLITGEPGVGKSRLVAELAADALGRGGHVLLGRCHPSTQILPFGPWVDAFRLGGVIGAATLGAMEPAWRAELARLFPEAGGPGLPASSENPLRLFEAVGRLVLRVARARPTVVVLEDCHWADEMTLSLVAFVARQIGSWPVILVVTVREDETAETPLVQRTLAELRQAPAAQLLALAPLARADVGDLVRAVVGPGVEARRAERLETRVWTTSEGNAFVALEALHAWGSDVRAEAEPPLSLPERVRELVTTRLARLSDAGRKTVAVAAVLGREFDFALLQHAAELSEEDAAGALEELVRRRVVGGVGERFQFTHDRIREVAHDELLPQRRRLIHARVVNALETLCGGEIDAHALRLAQHCREAALWDKAVGHWRRAAAQAAERSALPQAVECLEGALAALDRLPGDRRDVVEQSIDVRIDLRGALFAGRGEVDRVRDVLATAAALASEIGDSRRLARVLVLQAHNYGIVAGEMALGEQCARRALTVAESCRSLDWSDWLAPSSAGSSTGGAPTARRSRHSGTASSSSRRSVWTNTTRRCGSRCRSARGSGSPSLSRRSDALRRRWRRPMRRSGRCSRLQAHTFDATSTGPGPPSISSAASTSGRRTISNTCGSPSARRTCRGSRPTSRASPATRMPSLDAPARPSRSWSVRSRERATHSPVTVTSSTSVTPTCVPDAWTTRSAQPSAPSPLRTAASNPAAKPARCGSSATCAAHGASTPRLRQSTVTPLPSRPRWACGRSSPTATPVSLSSRRRPTGTRRPTSTRPSRPRFTQRWRCRTGSAR